MDHSSFSTSKEMLSPALRFAQSMILGKSGTFEVKGITVDFESDDTPIAAHELHLSIWRQLRRLFTLIHEFGHVGVMKLTYQSNPDTEEAQKRLGEPIHRIVIDTATVNGLTQENPHCRTLRTPLVEALGDAAGPLASAASGMALMGITVFLLRYLKPSLVFPIIMLANWGLLGGILPELTYLFEKDPNADWKKIFRKSKTVFAGAVSLLVGLNILGLFAYFKVIKGIFCSDFAKARMAQNMNTFRELFKRISK